MTINYATLPAELQEQVKLAIAASRAYNQALLDQGRKVWPLEEEAISNRAKASRIDLELMEMRKAESDRWQNLGKEAKDE